MDRFEQMRVFVSVVEAGGFSRAAPRAAMSRAAISKHVMQLEERLGARLLNRTTRHVSLTDAGRRFYDQCRRILGDVSAAEVSVARAGAEPSGELRIVAPTNFGLTMIGPAISEFLLAYRDISVDLSLNDQLIDPIDGGYDIAIRVIVGQPPDSTSLRAVRLSTSRRILCASPDYLARRGTPRQPEDLAGPVSNEADLHDGWFSFAAPPVGGGPCTSPPRTRVGTDQGWRGGGRGLRSTPPEPLNGGQPTDRLRPVAC